MPEEIPNQREREMHPILHNEEKLLKVLTMPVEKEEPEEEIYVQGIPDIAMKIEVKAPIVRLSWERNIKTVTNWMRKHMEAYPETEWWFLVLFDTDPESWFYVDICSISDGEPDIKINGINYRIYPYKIDHKNIKKITDLFKKEIRSSLVNNDYINSTKNDMKKNIRK